MIRKLASIQTVTTIEPIPGADAIELARIQGWQSVVKKGEFRAGERGVFFEIDAQLPDLPVFSFLWTPRHADAPVARPANFRLRTVKLRGCLSQGLLLPLTAFLDELPNELDNGLDLTGPLGVTKWEPPLPQTGDVAGPFISGVPKTDEERVQSAPAVLEELKGLPWIATVKCDGTSVTFGVDRLSGAFSVCSRNWALARGPSTAWRQVERYGIEALLAAHPHLVLQAELVGPGIQQNRLDLKESDLRVFNVFDQDAGRYFDHDESAAFLEAHGLPMVPEIIRGDAFQHTQDTLLALAEGFYPGTNNDREGIVIRPLTERVSTTLAGRLSFKVISNRFLLKGSD